MAAIPRRIVLAPAIAAPLLAALAQAEPLDIPSPWIKGAGKAYVLTIEQQTDDEYGARIRRVSMPLQVRVLARDESESRVEWQFGPSRLERDDCPTRNHRIAALLGDGDVRPALALRVDDYGALHGVANRDAANAQALALIERAAARATRNCPAAMTVESWNAVAEFDSDGSDLSGPEAALFFMPVGVQLDRDEPTEYDDAIDYDLSLIEIKARSVWQVLEHSRKRQRVRIAWRREADPATARKEFAEIARDLVQLGVISAAEANEPEPVAAREHAQITLDTRSGWLEELRSERIIRAGRVTQTERIVFTAR